MSEPNFTSRSDNLDPNNLPQDIRFDGERLFWKNDLGEDVYIERIGEDQLQVQVGTESMTVAPTSTQITLDAASQFNVALGAQSLNMTPTSTDLNLDPASQFNVVLGTQSLTMTPAFAEFTLDAASEFNAVVGTQSLSMTPTSTDVNLDPTSEFNVTLGSQSISMTPTSTDVNLDAASQFNVVLGTQSISMTPTATNLNLDPTSQFSVVLGTQSLSMTPTTTDLVLDSAATFTVQSGSKSISMGPGSITINTGAGTSFNVSEGGTTAMQVTSSRTRVNSGQLALNDTASPPLVGQFTRQGFDIYWSSYKLNHNNVVYPNTSPYSATVLDDIIVDDSPNLANFVIDLPTISNVHQGFKLVIVNASTEVLHLTEIQANGGNLVGNGGAAGASKTITASQANILISDGSNVWLVLD